MTRTSINFSFAILRYCDGGKESSLALDLWHTQISIHAHIRQHQVPLLTYQASYFLFFWDSHEVEIFFFGKKFIEFSQTFNPTHVFYWIFSSLNSHFLSRWHWNSAEAGKVTCQNQCVCVCLLLWKTISEWRHFRSCRVLSPSWDVAAILRVHDLFKLMRCKCPWQVKIKSWKSWKVKQNKYKKNVMEKTEKCA